MASSACLHWHLTGSANGRHQCQAGSAHRIKATSAQTKIFSSLKFFSPQTTTIHFSKCLDTTRNKSQVEVDVQVDLNRIRFSLRDPIARLQPWTKLPAVAAWATAVAVGLNRPAHLAEATLSKVPSWVPRQTGSMKLRWWRRLPTAATQAAVVAVAKTTRRKVQLLSVPLLD